MSNRKYINIEYIQLIFKSHNNIDEILNKYDKNELNFNYKKRFEKSIEILKENEKNTDIKVTDFILENYKNYRVLLTKSHPTSKLLIFCANKILERLNIKLLSLDLDENYCNLQDSEYHRIDNKWPITKQCALDLELNYNDGYEADIFFKQMLRNLYNIYKRCLY